MYQTGILIGGCGLYDGTETHEAVLAMLAVDRRGWRARCLTTDRDQLHVVDHTSGNEQEGPVRRILEESARLCRGRIAPLQEFLADELDALVVPGGYGCAKNLMTGFAEPGRSRQLHREVADLMKHCLQNRKPIGLIGLADLLIYPLLPELENRFAAWQHGEDPVIDIERRVAYTPGYRAGDRIGAVAAGIDGLMGVLGRFLESEG